jgi:hypothetical protein
MIVRYALLLVVVPLLGGCCLSGNCYAPVAGSAGVATAPAAPTAGVVAAPTTAVTTSAPDGLGPSPTEESLADAPAKPKRAAQRRRDFESFSDTSAASRYRGDSWEEQQAADRADEERLKRKLIICQNCSSKGY